MNPRVGIIMGSDSDLPVMQEAAKVLEELGVPHEVSIVSAHRTPERMFNYAKEAASRGLSVIIAGAGGAAAAAFPRCNASSSGVEGGAASAFLKETFMYVANTG